MNCARCGHIKGRVLQTRRGEPDSILRQRICRECGYTWFTLEMEMPDGAVVWTNTGLAVKEGYKHIKFS
jgi:transcriptional regulator NrdR family protein